MRHIPRLLSALLLVLSLAAVMAPSAAHPAGAEGEIDRRSAPALASNVRVSVKNALNGSGRILGNAALKGSLASYAVMTQPIGSFPTEGSTYVVMSTGIASSITAPNDSRSLGTNMGNTGPHGQDSVEIVLLFDYQDAESRCVAFDYQLRSEEFPEFINSAYNDRFMVERGESAVEVNDGQVSSVANIAFDTNGDYIDINSAFGVFRDTETTFDGATPVLTTTTSVALTESGLAKLTFSLFDIGDSLYDTAVLLDNVRFIEDVNCELAGSEAIDTDGDALLDDWEINGYDFDGDGTIDVDLPAMGADPNVKDVFVEVDWMIDESEENCLFDICFGPTNARPTLAAMDQVVAAFARAPESIRLHVDAGAESAMSPGATWGTLSESSGVLLPGKTLGTAPLNIYSWAEFEAVKRANFDPARRDIFHYSVFALAGPVPGLHGMSRGFAASDFTVFTEDLNQQSEAATFMHELGHNLALRHGGNDNINGKANYLSIMNYSYAVDGLVTPDNQLVADALDFSRRAMSPLDENALVESSGVGYPDGSKPQGFGVRHLCPDGSAAISDASIGIDFNCDGTVGAGEVSVDISGGGSQVLESLDDWTNLVFDGGVLGRSQTEVVGVDVTPLTDEPVPPPSQAPTRYQMTRFESPRNVIVGEPFIIRAVFENRGTAVDDQPRMQVTAGSGFDVASEQLTELPNGQVEAVVTVRASDAVTSGDYFIGIKVGRSELLQGGQQLQVPLTVTAQESVCDGGVVEMPVGVTLVSGDVVVVGQVPDLPCDSYTLEAISTDPQHRPGHQTDQLNERWYLELRHGERVVFTSAKTRDLAEEATLQRDLLGAVQAHMSGLTVAVIHSGVSRSGSPNSVTIDRLVFTAIP